MTTICVSLLLQLLIFMCTLLLMAVISLWLNKILGIIQSVVCTHILSHKLLQ